jgi:hypothetical protein
MPPRTTAASVKSEEHDRRISDLERHMLTIAGKQADIAAQQKTHEEVCGERYKGLSEDITDLKADLAGNAAELKSDMKVMGSAVADIARKMTERVGGSQAVREVISYVIAIASILAALYSGGLVHVGH